MVQVFFIYIFTEAKLYDWSELDISPTTAKNLINSVTTVLLKQNLYINL